MLWRSFRVSLAFGLLTDILPLNHSALSVPGIPKRLIERPLLLRRFPLSVVPPVQQRQVQEGVRAAPEWKERLKTPLIGIPTPLEKSPRFGTGACRLGQRFSLLAVPGLPLANGAKSPAQS